MKVYLIKLAMRGISPMITRRLKIAGGTSLAELHHAIQISLQWDDDYLHQFHIHGKDYGIHYVGGMSFSDNAYEVYLDEFCFDTGDKFRYEYNFFEHWIVDIRIENIEESGDTNPTPICCVKGSGIYGVEKYDVHDATIKLFQTIVDAKKNKTTVGEIRSLLDDINSLRFNRHLINERFKSDKTEGV